MMGSICSCIDPNKSPAMSVTLECLVMQAEKRKSLTVFFFYMLLQRPDVILLASHWFCCRPPKKEKWHLPLFWEKALMVGTMTKFGSCSFCPGKNKKKKILNWKKKVFFQPSSQCICAKNSKSDYAESRCQMTVFRSMQIYRVCMWKYTTRSYVCMNDRSSFVPCRGIHKLQGTLHCQTYCAACQ